MRFFISMLLFFHITISCFENLVYENFFLESIDCLLPSINNACMEFLEPNNYLQLKNIRSIKCLKLSRTTHKELLNLPPNLRYLKLQKMYFFSGNKHSMYDLKDLHTLILSNNLLSLNGIEKLKKLRYLDIRGNDGHYIPDTFFKLKLHKLDFSNNLFRHKLGYNRSEYINYSEKYVKILYKLMNITSELILRSNFLSALNLEYPESKLYHLDLAFNELTEISRSILKLKNLRILNLEFNYLTKIPKFFSTLQLKKLYLSNNNLERLYIANRSLEVLNIGDNKNITELKLENLDDLKSLKITLNDNIKLYKLGITKLHINCKDITKKIILDLPNLKNLHIHLCKFSLFPQIKSPLEELTISSTKCTPSRSTNEIFKQLSQIPTLKTLKITGTFLKIPEIIYKMNNLEELHLTEDYLTKIPTGIIKMKNLKYLNLSDNFITKINTYLIDKNITINLKNNPICDGGDLIYHIKSTDKKNKIKEEIANFINWFASVINY